MTWGDIRAYLESWFIYSGVEWHYILIAIGLALLFGGIWIAFYRQPRFRDSWPVAVLVFSAFFTVVAVALIQMPLQYYLEEGMTNLWDILTLNDWLLLAGIPIILLSGLVQEGAKMVPMVFWWRGRKGLDPKMGLAIGALAGFGFGVFEGFWMHSYALGSGWTWDVIINNGFVGIAPYWERFFTIGFHIAASAIAGYGLAKGLGWQFYLIAAGLHALINYSVLIYQKGYFSLTGMEIYIAVVAVLVAIAAIMLRYRKGKVEEPLPPIEPPAPVETDV
jgi:RsiW-degrading membrane proteinase PrsW (M82 family)